MVGVGVERLLIKRRDSAPAVEIPLEAEYLYLLTISCKHVGMQANLIRLEIGICVTTILGFQY